MTCLIHDQVPTSRDCGPLGKNTTHLSLGEGREEEILERTVGSPCPNPQQKGNGVNSRRLADDGDDGLVHSADFERSIHCTSNCSAQ